MTNQEIEISVKLVSEQIVTDSPDMPPHQVLVLRAAANLLVNVLQNVNDIAMAARELS